MLEVLKSILFGIVEGITEWLPISSTGHMLLLNEVVELNGSKNFIDLYMVIIQLGAILAVIVVFWPKIWPIKNKTVEKSVVNLWLKIAAATVPIVVFGFLFGEKIEEKFYNPLSISLMLIIYGIFFIVIETINKKRKSRIESSDEISFKIAIFIGLAQVLSIIPGTSRSGVTIIFALAIGVSRKAASEFTFLLAIPAMLGASLLKLSNFGFAFTSSELCLLLIGMITSFIVSLTIVKLLLNYIKKYDFKAFGWYRILLGILILSILL